MQTRLLSHDAKPTIKSIACALHQQTVTQPHVARLTSPPVWPVSWVSRVSRTRANVIRPILILMVDFNVCFGERLAEVKVGAFHELLLDFGSAFDACRAAFLAVIRRLDLRMIP